MRLTIKDVITKSKDMLSITNNPPFFRYRVNHYLKKKIPFNRARKWAKKNQLLYENRGIDVIWFETYDGSDQVCHPDIAIWNDQYWMVSTPYPYGMEEYENPSLFYGSKLTDMHPIKNNPIALPSKKGYGSHLSDPCLWATDEQLFCFYRDTINHGDCVENRICYKSMGKDLQLSSEKILFSSFQDGLLSPAVLRVANELCLFFVSYVHGALTLTKCIMTDDLTLDTGTAINILPANDDWDVWHFDVKATDNDVKFLLLKRAKKDRKKFKLQIGYFDLDMQQVIINEEVSLPDELQSVIANPYKSCLIPNSKKILLSFRDNNAVYVTKIIDAGEKNERES